MGTRGLESWRRLLERIHTKNLDMLRIVGCTDSPDGERKLIGATWVSFVQQKIENAGAVKSMGVATYLAVCRFDDHTVGNNDTVTFYDGHPELRMCSCEYSDKIENEYQDAVREAHDFHGATLGGLSDEFLRPDVLRRPNGRLFCECAGFRPGKPGYGRHPYRQNKYFYFGANNLKKLHEESRGEG